MHYILLTEDTDGTSQFSDAEIALHDREFAPPAPPMPMSDPEPCRSLLYMTLPPGWTGGQHPSPRRQVAFCLSGQLRVKAGNGEVRDISEGGIWRMEDTSGTGHETWVLGDRPVRLAIVQLD